MAGHCLLTFHTRLPYHRSIRAGLDLTGTSLGLDAAFETTEAVMSVASNLRRGRAVEALEGSVEVRQVAETNLKGKRSDALVDPAWVREQTMDADKAASKHEFRE